MAQPCCGPVFWLYVAVCVCLVMFAGLMSGLTLGLMSLSLVDLEVIAKAGKPEDRKNAMKILPVVKNQHLLLCTLLIGNSLAMEALPIFLNSLVPAWGAILLSVTLILAFGEIIPQSICSRYGLSVGARTAWIVRVLLLIFFPITYPISKVLDWILGKGHYALLRRAELKTLVDMHGNENEKEAYEAYCNHAHNVGFSVRKDHHYYWPTFRKIKSKDFVCSKAGFKKMPDLNFQLKYQKSDTGTGCSAMIRFTVDETEYWKVKKIIENHNHDLFGLEDRHLLRLSRNVCDVKALVLKSMTEAGIRIIDAYTYLFDEVGGVQNVGFSKRDACNFIQKEKNKE
ncbi:hypothetical protein M5K25_017558 [Dendrobium thyrsiflorum]|uniref:CNNM transmembrane domain-containing protein n=1 Tax=Dendrobium thyrsiflorum TaxID=117978 RepID=A0ABD0UMM1_DENTH